VLVDSNRSENDSNKTGYGKYIGMARYRPGRAPRRRQSEASRALVSTRRAAGLQLAQVAKAMGSHPRTIKRWEIGETRPSKEEWSRLARLFAAYVPAKAVELARIAEVPSPITPPIPIDPRAFEEALVRAADLLDVAPKRVRAAVRQILADVTAARGTLDDLLCAAQEKAEPRAEP
jgi:transcriptional regulator with XRE-family HTH domain